MDRQRDKFEALAAEAPLGAVIFGNAQLTDFDLIDLSAAPISPDKAAAIQAGNMYFVGVVGLVDGKFRTALAVPLDADTTSVLAAAFVELVAVKLTKPASDRVDWLEELHLLKDPRTEN
jgi:hypothetical protein